MSSLRPPFLLAVCALGGGWWLGTSPPDAAPSPAASLKDTAPSPVGAPLSLSGLARRAALLQARENLSLTDIRRLVDSGKLYGTDLSRLAGEWAMQDPAGMWRWLESGGRKKMGHFDVSDTIFTTWLQSDPDAAIAAFRSTRYEFQSRLHYAFLSKLLTADDNLRGKLLPLLDDLTTTDSGVQVESGKERETAAKLLALPASRGRDRLLEAAARTWLSRDVQGAIAWVSTLTEPLKSKIAASLAAATFEVSYRMNSAVGDKDGAKSRARLAWAGDWLNNTAPPEVRRRLGLGYVTVLSESDPGAALTWAQDNLTAGALTQAFHEILVRQSVQDPSKSRALVDQFPPGPLKQRATFSAAGRPGADSAQWLLTHAEPGAPGWADFGSSWAFDHPDDVRKFVTAQNVETLPKGFLRSATDSLARKDPEGTLTWAANLKSADVNSNALLQWSQLNPLEAAAWVKNHPGAPLNDSGTAALADQYFRRSASDAVDWAVSLPPGPARDAFITAIRKQLSSAPSLKPDQRAGLEAKLSKP
jgi:hypothetical protein